MANNPSMVFPIPLPVMFQEQGQDAKPATEETLKDQNEKLDDQNFNWRNYLSMFGVFEQREKKKEKEESKIRKSNLRLNTIWEKLKLNKWFPTVMKNLGDLVKSSFAKASSLFGDIMEFVWYAAVDPAGGLIVAVVNMMAPMFMNLITLVINVFISVVPTIIQTIVKYIPVFFNMIVKLTNSLVKIAPKILTSLLKALPILIKGLMKALPVLIKGFVSLLTAVWTALKESWPEIRDSFVSAMIQFKNDLFAAFPDLKKTFDQITDWFDFTKGDFSTKLKDLVTGAWETFKSFGDKIHEMVGDVFGPKTKKIIEGLSIALGFLTIALVAYKVATIAANIATWLLAGAMTVLTSPITLTILAIMALIAVFVLIYVYWDDMVKWFDESWKELTTWFGEKWTSFKTSIVEGFNNALNSVTEAVTGWWTSLKETVTGWWKTTKEETVAAVSEAGTALKDGLQKNIVDPSIASMKSLQEDAESVRSKYTKISEKLSLALRKSTDTTEKFKDKILGAFSSIRNISVPNLSNLLNDKLASAFNQLTSSFGDLSNVEVSVKRTMKLIDKTFSDMFDWISKNPVYLFLKEKVGAVTQALGFSSGGSTPGYAKAPDLSKYSEKSKISVKGRFFGTNQEYSEQSKQFQAAYGKSFGDDTAAVLGRYLELKALNKESEAKAIFSGDREALDFAEKFEKSITEQKKELGQSNGTLKEILAALLDPKNDRIKNLIVEAVKK